MRIPYLLYALRARLMRLASRCWPLTGRPIVLIFDPALIGYNGHHAEFARLLKEELSLSADVKIYANFSAQTGLLAQLRAEPVFWESIYVRSGEFALTYRKMIVSFLDSLRRVQNRYIRPSTIVIVHTATIHYLGALAAWYSGLPSTRRPKLFLQFQHRLEFELDRISWDEAAREGRMAAASLTRMGPVCFTSNSQSLAENISAQLEQPCTMMPLPVRWPTDLRPGPAAQREPVFGFFGALRQEKGAALMAQALPEFLARHEDARCIVHAPTEESDPSVVQMLSGIPQLELITHTFRDKDEYFDALRRCTCIVLPYDPIAYEMRTSGIFVEAMGLGQAIITTKGTWMASELRRWDHLGFLLPEFSAQGLLEALEQALSNLAGREFAVTPRSDVIEQNSPRSFCSELLRLVER